MRTNRKKYLETRIRSTNSKQLVEKLYSRVILARQTAYGKGPMIYL